MAELSEAALARAVAMGHRRRHRFEQRLDAGAAQ
jgi:hypothetical protein